MSEHQQTQQSKESKSNIPTKTCLPKQILTSHPAAIIQRVRINPRSLTHADVMQLQRTIGNRAVGKLLFEIGLIPSKSKQTQPVQMQTIPGEEEEPLQGKIIESIQRQEIPEEEESLQGKFESIQRQEIPEKEEPLQGKFAEPIQLQEIHEEEGPLQGKFENKSEQETCSSCSTLPIQRVKENRTGMPDNLKAGVESLSGIDMSDVRVHYNSSKPAEVGALAFTRGINIHVASGQERHLPHETWHVVQQAQGRVQPTIHLKNVAVNNEKGLEQEADKMGERAFTSGQELITHKLTQVVQQNVRGGSRPPFLQRQLMQHSFTETSSSLEGYSAPRAKGDRIGDVQEKYDELRRNVTYFLRDTREVIQREIVRGKDLSLMTFEQLEEFFNVAMQEGFSADEIEAIEKALDAIHKASGLQYQGPPDPDDYDLDYKGRQIRFKFERGLREYLIANQTRGGKLFCTFCKQEIILDHGKEVWTSKGGNQHGTAPPIDHDQPSWKIRLESLIKKNYDIQTFIQEGQKLYNAPPLRILHMTCNSKIGSKH